MIDTQAGEFESQRQRAFEHLVTAVRSLSVARRSSFVYAAALKPAIQVLEPEFNEKKLQFPGFGAFLREAQKAGLIELQQPGDMGPLMVTLHGEIDDVGAHEPPRPSVRKDLWEAFVDWDPSLIRVYDRVADRAYKYPIVASPTDSVAIANVRLAARGDSRRFVSIDPITKEETLARMSAFAITVSDQDKRGALERALNRPLSVHEFTEAVRHVELWQEWSNDRAAWVRSVIDGWMKKHDLTLEPTRQPHHQRATLASPLQWDELTLDSVRAIAHRAVDRMSLGDLLRLPIPLGDTLQP